MRKQDSRGRKGNGGPWTEQAVRDLLTNPVYGYGLRLEPSEVVAVHIQELEHILAKEQRERRKPFSLEELDQRFQTLFR